jgi:hypothetical protein
MDDLLEKIEKIKQKYINIKNEIYKENINFLAPNKKLINALYQFFNVDKKDIYDETMIYTQDIDVKYNSIDSLFVSTSEDDKDDIDIIQQFIKSFIDKYQI